MDGYDKGLKDIDNIGDKMEFLRSNHGKRCLFPGDPLSYYKDIKVQAFFAFTEKWKNR